MQNWVVLDTYTGIDHLYITCRVFSVRTLPDPHPLPPSTRATDWAERSLDRMKLGDYISRVASSVLADQSVAAELVANSLEQFLVCACDAAMPRRGHSWWRRAVHWWTPEIATLRRQCIIVQRVYQRAGRLALVVDWSEKVIFKKARKVLRTAIKRLQELCWTELCNCWATWICPTESLLKDLAARTQVQLLERDLMDHLFSSSSTLRNPLVFDTAWPHYRVEWYTSSC